MESRKERLQKAAARRRARDSSPGPAQPPPASGDKGNRKFFAVAAGAVILALVAFICGVHMGKALSDLHVSGETGPRIQDRQGKLLPSGSWRRGKSRGPSRKPGPPKRERAAKNRRPPEPLGRPLRRKPRVPPGSHPLPPRRKRGPIPQKPSTHSKWGLSIILRKPWSWSTN
jgi:hypothetical protein